MSMILYIYKDYFTHKRIILCKVPHAKLAVRRLFATIPDKNTLLCHISELHI
jgi:hypothetical protein